MPPARCGSSEGHLPPPPADRQHRRPGALRDRIGMPPDFDALPADLLAAMEGEEE